MTLRHLQKDPTQSKWSAKLVRALLTILMPSHTSLSTSTSQTGELLHNSNEQKHKAKPKLTRCSRTRIHNPNPRAQLCLATQSKQEQLIKLHKLTSYTRISTSSYTSKKMISKLHKLTNH